MSNLPHFLKFFFSHSFLPSLFSFFPFDKKKSERDLTYNEPHKIIRKIPHSLALRMQSKRYTKIVHYSISNTYQMSSSSFFVFLFLFLLFSSFYSPKGGLFTYVFASKKKKCEKKKRNEERGERGRGEGEGNEGVGRGGEKICMCMCMCMCCDVRGCE